MYRGSDYNPLMLVTMAKKDIAGNTLGASPAQKNFAFVVSKITETKTGKYCVTLEKEGVAVKNMFGTLSTETMFQLFLREHELVIGQVLNMQGFDFDSALIEQGLVRTRITDPETGKVQNKLVPIGEEEE